MSSVTKKALVDIFEGPSDDEEFLGFKNPSSEGFSEESRDSLHSQNSWKPETRFRSKFITNELAQVFMDTDGEDEFEGFSEEEDSLHGTWMSPVEPEDSDDIGFYSDDETQAPPQRRSSGLCVAFRFPGKNSTRGNKVLKKSTVPAVSRPHGRTGQKRRAVDGPGSNTKVMRRGMSSDGSEEEDNHVLHQRNKNIQENKAMLAKLFADLSALPELTVNTTPKKKRKQFTPRSAGSEPQSERRNPSRKARPPEHFGLELEPVTAAKPRKIVEIDLQKLLEVDDDLRVGLTPKRKYRKRSSMRMPDDITEEELDNVADRAKDKILDKENGSTCHQCRQKTLDTKTECRNPYCQGVKGQFCGPCLRNRYGEDVRTALLDSTWICPLCRGICNCSLCRKRDGRCATGALTHLAKYNGYDNVKEYLESLQKKMN